MSENIEGGRPRGLPRLPLRQGAMAAAAATEGALGRARLPLAVWIYLLCVLLPIGFKLGPLSITTLRLFLILMIIPLCMRVFTKRAGPIIATDWLFVLHMAWATVALAFNNPDRVVEQAGSVGIEFLGGYFVTRAYIRTQEQFIALCRVMVKIVLLLLPFSLFEAATGRPLILEILQAVPGTYTVAITEIGMRMGLHRVQGVFVHPIHYGLFCSVAFSLSFVALEGQASTPWRWVRSGMIGLAGFLALSSGALLALILQIGLIGWYTVLAGFKQRWWLLVGLFALAYVAIDVLSTRTPIRVFMSYATFSPATAYWRSLIFEWGMTNVWANPIFGLGLNDWVRPSFMRSGSMDNFWLVMAVRYGIPGFLVVALGYGLALARVMRLQLDAVPQLLLIRRAWVFTFLGLSFTLCTVHVWGNIYSFVFFMFGAGIWLITSAPGTLGPAEPLPAAEPGRRPAAPAARGPRGASPDVRPPVAPPALPAAAPRDVRGGPRFSRFAPRPETGGPYD